MTATTTKAAFADLGLSPILLRALSEEGYTHPTPIQAQTIPTALEGRDVLGCAQTGTGKTAAFALPAIQSLMEEAPDKSRRGPALPRVLVLSPTRELASQIADSFKAYSRHTGLAYTTVFGGVSQRPQERALRNGVDILVATPGRLIDLLEQGVVDLSAVRILVLDEADRMLDMGFIQPIRRIAAELAEPRQTLLFSATMPKEIMRLADSLMKNPAKVAVNPVASTAPLIEQAMYMVPRNSKPALLQCLLNEKGVARALVFTRTKHGADRLTKHLNRAGLAADSIHGNKSQNQRERALASFRTGRSRVLVATDVAARGLDVDGITHVFNFDLPVEAEAYVHRIGRTGRAGATGQAISFCDTEERQHLRSIERLTGVRFDAITTLPDLRPYFAPPAAQTPQHNGPGATHAPHAQRHNPARDPRPFRKNRGPGPNSAPAPAPVASAAPSPAPKRTYVHSGSQPNNFAPARPAPVRKPIHSAHPSHGTPAATTPGAHAPNHGARPARGPQQGAAPRNGQRPAPKKGGRAGAGYANQPNRKPGRGPTAGPEHKPGKGAGHPFAAR